MPSVTFTCSSERTFGSSVVSQSCSAFISPSPLALHGQALPAGRENRIEQRQRPEMTSEDSLRFSTGD